MDTNLASKFCHRCGIEKSKLPGGDDGSRYCPYCSTIVEGQVRQALDPVNHPEHYTSHPSGIECIQISREMNFCLGNALKYVWRAGLKDPKKKEEDLRKAIWYIEEELGDHK